MFQFYNLVDVYTKYPTKINTEIRFNIRESEIPSISVCYHYIMLIGKNETIKLYSKFDEMYKKIYSRINEFDTDEVKLENSWRTIRTLLTLEGVNVDVIKQTFIQRPIIHCYLVNEFGESIQCQQKTNIRVTRDDKYQCYSLFNQMFKKRKLNPLTINVPLKGSRPFLHFYIWLNNSNAVYSPRRVKLVIHPPHDNPLDHISSSIEIETKSYQISYSKIIALLLPSPYKTDCVNYNEDTDYDSQQDCLDQCLVQLTLKHCSCWPSSVQSPNITQLDQVCWLVKPNQHNCTSEVESKCYGICKSPDCIQERYSFEVRNSHQRLRAGPQWVQDLKNTTAKITILTPFNFETTFIHKPEYNLIQIICYIVSLLGFWYGISVLSIYNFVSRKIKAFQRKNVKIFSTGNSRSNDNEVRNSRVKRLFI